MRDLQAAAHTLGLHLEILHASSERDFDTVFTNLAQRRAGALVIGPDALFSGRSEALAALALRHAVPAIYRVGNGRILSSNINQSWISRVTRDGRPRGSRNRAILSEEFIAALLRHFRRDGERAIARMARTQPAAYCKLLGLLIPKEHKVEHSRKVSELSDDQLNDMIEVLSARIEARAQGIEVPPLIDVTPEGEVVALPAPNERSKRVKPKR